MEVKLEFLKLSNFRKSPKQYFERLKAGEEFVIVSRDEVLGYLVSTDKVDKEEFDELMSRMNWPRSIPEDWDRYDIAREMNRRGSKRVEDLE